MKIVQINTECEHGSTGRIVFDLHSKLNSLNIENYIFCSGNNICNVQNAFPINNKYGVKIDHFLSYILGNTGLHSTFSTIKLVRNLKKIKPDVIHLHNIHGYFINFRVLFRYLNKYDGKIIWTLHDCWSFTGRCAHYEFIKCRKWQKGCGSCPRFDKYPRTKYFDRSNYIWKIKQKYFTNCKNLTIVTPSKWLKQQVSQSFLSQYNCVVINNGIDTTKFYYSEEEFLQKKYNLYDKIVLLAVSSVWGRPKGLLDYIELSKVLPDKYKIVLVGTNDDIDKVLPSNIISIHRTTDQEELRKIYCSADVFVNLTKEDTYPTVNIEAVLCGLPIITYSNTGSKEIAEENNGIVVDDFDELVSRIKSTDFKKNELNYVCYNKDKSYSKYLELYFNDLEE